ncbi:hypothetical protein IY145_15580 [Methylosinus sp. H3A]|uniref:hypothetical protein n=1 Tax=Methylosinus sp. H3A TaxID=2785786 RepID=UPI0018C281B0|nr:hypothetical protein [Methylosinus sp. H3A]MBG0810793.1 hypothetical protein [Methylosinus sp. H3A]
MTIAIDESAPPPSVRLVALNAKLRWACFSIRLVAAAWVVFGLGLTSWNWGHRADSLETMHKLYGLDPESVSALGYWSSTSIALSTWALAALAAARLWRLTGIYLDGRVFSIAAAEALRLFALTGLAATVFNIGVRPFIFGLVSTELLAKLPAYAWINPQDVFYLLFCGCVFALSVILETAAEFVDEHERFV